MVLNRERVRRRVVLDAVGPGDRLGLRVLGEPGRRVGQLLVLRHGQIASLVPLFAAAVSLRRRRFLLCCLEIRDAETGSENNGGGV